MTRTYLLIILTMLLFLSHAPSLVAGENCSLLSGSCRNACSQGEEAASGAFDDCGEKQECCLVHAVQQEPIKCCITSFDAAKYGPVNCRMPDNNRCLTGSGSPVQCMELKMCKGKNTQ